MVEKIGNATRFTSSLGPGRVSSHPKFALFVKEGADSVTSVSFGLFSVIVCSYLSFALVDSCKSQRTSCRGCWFSSFS